jgi:hypothetical protein
MFAAVERMKAGLAPRETQKWLRARTLDEMCAILAENQPLLSDVGG